MAPFDIDCKFLLAFNSNYGHILYHFEDEARHFSKIVIFSYPTCIRLPRPNTATTFGVETVERWVYQVVKKSDDTFSHFHTILVCDGQTDRYLVTP